MTITMTRPEVRPETLQQRRDALEDLAVRWEDMPAKERKRRLKEVTALRGDDMWIAMTELRETIGDADQLETGEMTWHEYMPELTSGVVVDRQEQAWLIARCRVDDAMTVLLRDPVMTP